MALEVDHALRQRSHMTQADPTMLVAALISASVTASVLLRL